ncbi:MULTISPECIES: ribonuclease J [Rhodomicrobium]|uniref:ribonuclease J n=1 Tax=Rhodomicrobium TaxID=1068 RepID=UPI000B4A74F2|nr:MULTISPECIES: ribonuclease J [Rhodomicrobium]
MAARGNENELVLLPLGGVGEIGMNVYLYGLGTPRRRKWLMVDLGVTFPDDREPGVDLVLPDLRFIEEERNNLVGILITHAHEDHFGAVAEMWPRLGAPVYGTKFTMAMLKEKLHETPWRNDVPLHEIPLGGRLNIGPFDVDLVTMAHSIPETSAVAIRTELGTVLHTADWKIDLHPGLGAPTDEKKLRLLGDEGVDVVVSDSTNILSDGVTASEKDVALSLAQIIKRARGRVAITSFASSVARLLNIAHAAEAADRHLVLVGRSMHRIVDLARETGLWPESVKTLNEEDYGHLPPENVVALLTGSQGEPRAALARVAENQHPQVTLSRGDLVIFSARAIPGNESGIIRIQNKLADMGVEVMTEWAGGPIHTSGHPRRGEVGQLYDWLRPKAVVPVHGESRHLEAHVTFARERGIAAVSQMRNGNMLRLLPGEPEIVDDAPVGRIYRDGGILIPGDEDSIRQRRKLSFVGSVVVAVTMTAAGEMAAEPQVSMSGVPKLDSGGDSFEEIAIKAAFGAIQSIPRARRKSPELVGEAVRKSVRAAINNAWGKKPICSVMVSVV